MWTFQWKVREMIRTMTMFVSMHVMYYNGPNIYFVMQFEKGMANSYFVVGVIFFLFSEYLGEEII